VPCVCALFHFAAWRIAHPWRVAARLATFSPPRRADLTPPSPSSLFSPYHALTGTRHDVALATLLVYTL